MPHSVASKAVDDVDVGRARNIRERLEVYILERTIDRLCVMPVVIFEGGGLGWKPQ